MPKAEVVTESVPKPNVLWIAKNIQLYNNSANNALMSIHVPECWVSCIGKCSDDMHSSLMPAAETLVGHYLNQWTVVRLVGLCIRYNGLIICRS